MTQRNPACQPSCDPSGGPGHPVTTAVDLEDMRGFLAEEGLPLPGGLPPADPAARWAVIRALYAAHGFGYHNIADLLGMTHEEARTALLTNGESLRGKT